MVAVDDVTIEVKRGEFFSLLGPSGCGKTTSLRMIAGFEEPDEGRVELTGRDIVGVAAVQAQRQHRVPVVRAVPPPHRRRQRRVRAQAQEGRRRAKSKTG